MNFFEHQARARKQSRRLVWVFLLAVVAIVAAIDLVVAIALGLAQSSQENQQSLPALADTQPILVVTSLITLTVILVASLFKTAQLRGGGGDVARSLGGTLISPDTTQPGYRRLRNVVEEIAIASGVPVPEIYVMEQESGINAFAAGYTPANAAVAVTRGCLEKLSRDELQGVIAHEFSHILNGDMRLNIRLMGMIFGILVLHVIGREVMNVVGRSGGRSSKKNDPTAAIVIVAIALMVLGWLGVFLGRLIKAGISRQREFLADSSAVQFTRQTSGIAGALKKISGLDQGSKLQVNGEEVSHMLFGDGVGFSSLFATHPPLEQRIKALEPGFNLRLIEAQKKIWNSPSYVGEERSEEVISGFGAGAGAGAIAVGALAPQVGQPGAAQFEQAEMLHHSLPEELLAAARGEQAPALLLALLLQLDHAAGARQAAFIESVYGLPMRESVQGLAMKLAGAHPAQRLPLASIALPALHHWPRERLLQLVKTITFLIQADGQIAAFEYCLGRLVREQLNEALNPRTSQMFGRKKLAPCRDALQQLLSVLAQQGHPDSAAARQAYLTGMQLLLPRESLPYQPQANWTTALDKALGDLDQLSPAASSLLVEALVATIGHDGRVTVAEAELLRVVCGTLHCPLPPLLNSQSGL